MTDNKHKHSTQVYQRQPVEAPTVDEKFLWFIFQAGITHCGNVLHFRGDDDARTALAKAIEAWKAQQAEGE